MNREAMKQLITEALSRKLGDGFHIGFKKAFKTNQELDCLTIERDEETASPVIYLDPFYKDLDNGADIGDVIEGILDAYSTAKTKMEDFDISTMYNFGFIKSRLYVALVNRHLNQELLQNVPHTLFLDDFAVTIRCMVSIADGSGTSFLVHNCHLSIWQTTAEALMSIALQNTREMLGVELMNMNEAIKELLPDITAKEIPDPPMWVMTNRLKLSGAATVLFDDVLAGFAKEHGSFYVIFSSLHEVLLLPASDNGNIDSLSKINQDVNAAQVQKEDILGTKAYFYRKDRGFML